MTNPTEQDEFNRISPEDAFALLGDETRIAIIRALFCLAWIPIGVTNTIFMTLIQTYVPEGLVGRVTSVSISASAAAMPVGSLLGGIAGDAFGSTVVVAVTGAGFLFVTLYWIAHPLLRHVPAVEEIDPVEYGLRDVS